jgi:plasmid stabilization system protein ParE
MKYRVLFHPRAEQELVELHDYINDVASPERALAFMAGIRDYCLGFRPLPKRGTVRDDIMNAYASRARGEVSASLFGNIRCHTDFGHFLRWQQQ